MPVCLTALKLVFRHPAYIMVYIVLLGLLGLGAFGVSSSDAPAAESFNVAAAPFAVVDRDGSEASQGLAAFLSRRGQPVVLADEAQALQDAIAQNRVSCILIVPAGFGREFLAAARQGLPSPQLTIVESVDVSGATYLSSEASGFLNALRLSAALAPDASDRELVSQAAQAAELKAPMQIAQADAGINPNSLFPFFLRYSSYPLTCGVGILVALVHSGFKGGAVSRRNLAAPLSATRLNLQLALASTAIALMALAFLNLLALTPVIRGLRLWADDPLCAALMVLAMLVYSLLPLALGLLLSQFRLSDAALNGFINTVSLSMGFLSGIMMGNSDYLAGVMLAIGRLMPSYWYSEAIGSVASVGSAGLGSPTTGPLGYYLACLGVMMLFNLAVFSLALLAGRLRSQTADAGGNPTAEAA